MTLSPDIEPAGYRRPTRLVRLLSAIALLTLHSPNTIQAQSHPKATVSVHLAPCVEVDRDRLEWLLFLELGTSATQQQHDTAGSTVVSVDCVTQGIVVHLEDGLTRKSMRRTLRRSVAVDEDRERLLALAIAEFIVASWVELSLTQPAGLEPAAPKPPPQIVEAARRTAAAALRSTARPPPASSTARSPAQLGAALIWKNVLGRHGPNALGFGILLNWRVLGTFHLGINAHALFGEASRLEGTVGHQTIGGEVSARYALALGRQGQLGLGAGMTLAALTVIATPRNREIHHASSERDVTGGPFLSAQLSTVLGQDSLVALRATFGLVTMPVELNLDLDDSPLLETSGAWVGVSVRITTGL